MNNFDINNIDIILEIREQEKDLSKQGDISIIDLKKFSTKKLLKMKDDYLFTNSKDTVSKLKENVDIIFNKYAEPDDKFIATHMLYDTYDNEIIEDIRYLIDYTKDIKGWFDKIDEESEVILYEICHNLFEIYIEKKPLIEVINNWGKGEWTYINPCSNVYGLVGITRDYKLIGYIYNREDGILENPCEIINFNNV